MKTFSWILALIAGALLPLAFAPHSFFLLAVISPVLLLLLLNNVSSTKAFGLSFVYGIGLFACGASWIFISIDVYGNTSVYIATLITTLFVLILALFPAFTGWSLNRYFPNDTLRRSWLAFPSIWALIEWVRSWIFTGFPWLLLGQSQTSSPLHGYAPIVGVYGVSFLVAASAGLIYTLLKNKKRYISLFLLIIIWGGGLGLAQVQWSKKISAPLNITLLQGNIPQSIKWSEDQALKSFKLYKSLTEQHWQSQLIVWPEAAVTLLPSDAPDYLEALDKSAEQHNSTIITGIPIPHGTDADNTYFNAVIVLGKGGGHYFKRHLVPFGEYVPMENLLRGLIGFFNLPMSNFIPGPMYQELLNAAKVQIAPFVCYEIAYPNILRSDFPSANLLVTVSDDTWFDQSAAMYQHLQIAQFAAISTARYMLMDTNSGETAVIDPQGNILGKAPIAKVATLTGTVYGMQGLTPWVKLGDTPYLLLFAFLLFISGQKRK